MMALLLRISTARRVAHLSCSQIGSTRLARLNLAEERVSWLDAVAFPQLYLSALDHVGQARREKS